MIDNPFSLAGKKIFVTGASSGIGRGIAVMCARMGGQLIISGRDSERLNHVLESLEGSGHLAIEADLTSEKDIVSLSLQIPIVDGIVHCAGIGDRTLLRLVREKDIDRVMKINFNSPVLLQRAILKNKKISDGGSIVFIASRAAFAPSIGNGIYAASKGALISYAKVLSLELAERLIRVNCICPAMVWTELIKRDATLTGADYSEKEKSYPLKRYGQPEDVAGLAVYMLSDISSWMTGSIVDITGGANSL